MSRPLLLFALTAVTLSAADIKVMMIGAINPGFRNNAERYEHESGNKIIIVADTAPGLTRRIAAGDSGDLLIAPANVVDEAVKAGKAIESTRVLLVKVGIGVVTRKGSAAPAIASIDALKQALLQADRVVYNQGSSGLYIDQLFAQWGIADQLKAKTVRYANAAQVVNHVMAGKGNEIGFAPLPEVYSSDQGKLQSLGPMPGDSQNYTVYTGAAMAGANSETAKAFLRFLTTADSKRIFSAAGVD